MPSIGQEHKQEKQPKSILYSIGNEILAYEDSSKSNNETFHIFSQPDHGGNDEQLLLKAENKNLGSSNSPAFKHIKSNTKSALPRLENKFQETMTEKSRPIIKSFIEPQHTTASTVSPAAAAAVIVPPPSSIIKADLLHVIETPIDVDIDPEGSCLS